MTDQNKEQVDAVTDLVVKHIYREKNEIADSLSKLGSLIRFE